MPKTQPTEQSVWHSQSNVCLRPQDNYLAIAGKQHLLFRHNDIKKTCNLKKTNAISAWKMEELICLANNRLGSQ